MGITKKNIQVAEGLKLPVSKFIAYTNFGISERFPSGSMATDFISSPTPGTGFFVRDSESNSYNDFVEQERSKLSQSAFQLFFGYQYSFENEIDDARKLLKDKNSSEKKKQILDSYVNCLYIAKDEEIVERIVEAIRKKTKHQSNKYLVSVHGHYKSKIHRFEKDINSTRLDISQVTPAPIYEKWTKVMEAYNELIKVRRIWSVDEDSDNPFKQTFCDLGAFDFIYSPLKTPVLRCSDGAYVYLYPEYLIKSYSNLDFEVYPYEEINFTFGIIDVDTIDVTPNYFESKSRKLGRNKASQNTEHLKQINLIAGSVGAHHIGVLNIPEIGVQFYFSSVKTTKLFADALHDMPNTKVMS